MGNQDTWQQRYQDKEIPWDTGRPDAHLIRTVLQSPVVPGRLLEIGCGTGTNAIWLAQHGFSVTAVDISALAVQKAQEKAAAETDGKIDCVFYTADLLKKDIKGLPFEFAFDRGCFHSVYSDNQLVFFAERVSRHLVPGGRWLSLIGSADDPPRDTGPPRLSAVEIVTATEPLFEILRLESIRFDSLHKPGPRGWLCLMKKRDPAG
ncbi:MAG: class I SAM-dependent methyltransferase [Desulfobacteraceae bacterium]|nr:class I SAM-dependent methyltransferase [Desulfobacteraceae bacterium]